MFKPVKKFIRYNIVNIDKWLMKMLLSNVTHLVVDYLFEICCTSVNCSVKRQAYRSQNLIRDGYVRFLLNQYKHGTS